MKRQRILSAILIAIVIITILVFVSDRDKLQYKKTEVIESDIITLRFSSSWAGIDSKADLIEKLIHDFELENPKIKIVNESMYGEDFLFTLKADFASGNGPDVFGLWPGSDLQLLIDKKMIADLTFALADDRRWYENFDPRVFDTLNQGAAVYSIPFEIIYEGLYCNTDLFEQYGVNVPTTYDELKRAIRTFRANGIIPIAYNITPEGSFIYQNLIVQLSGKYETENPIDFEGTIRPGYIDAMYIMRELYQMGAFPKDAFTLDDVSRNQLFIEKKAAMIVQGSWFNSSALGDAIDIIPIPVENGHNAIVYGIGNGNFHISESTYEDPNKKEAALTFLKYLTSENSRILFSTSPAFMTSSLEKTDNYLKNLGHELIKSADELVGPPDHYINRIFWESTLIKEFPNMLEGDISPEALFDKMESD